MARVDFYILDQTGSRSRYLFACRLAEKAYRLEHTVHIHAATHDDAREIDELLWTFRDGSFVPHHVVPAQQSDMQSPVTVGCGVDVVEPRDLLINLCDDIPSFAASFARVAELVSSDSECKQQSRKRFAAYREQGHTLETHNV